MAILVCAASRFVECARLGAEQPGNSLQSLRRLAGDFAACSQHLAKRRKTFLALLPVGRQQIRNGGERCLLIDEEHEELLAHECLELGQRQSRPVIVQGAQAANGRQPTFIHTAARRADIQQAADHALAQTTCRNTRLQFSDPRPQQFTMQRRLSRLPRGTRVGGVDADSSLQHGQAIDRQETPFGEGFVHVPPPVKGCNDLPGCALLKYDEGILRRDGLAILRVSDPPSS